jgi:hypothetical protein
MTVEAFYAGWERYNDLVIGGVRELDESGLALSAPVADTSGTGHLPIWAIVAHLAGARVYWLCMVLGEPGIESVSFMDPGTLDGWEDDLSKPRSAGELVAALETSWSIVAGCLRRWTPEMLGEALPRTAASGVQYHTRQSILLRLITHDAFHAGEIALIQGMHDLPQLDLWPAGAHTVPGRP